MDYLQIKKLLLAEYVANGGKNTQEFLRGMNYLEDYLESGRNEHALNPYVDDLMFLQKRNEELQNTVSSLKKELADKKIIIKQFRQMNKDERHQWRTSNEMARMEMVYSRMVMQLEEKYRRKGFRHKAENVGRTGKGL